MGGTMPFVPQPKAFFLSQAEAAPLALPPLLAEALSKKGYDTLTPVQNAVANPALAGRDLLVSSQTGSGKTVAYGLGMASGLISAEGGTALPPAGKPLALVIAPTRELALQVQRELRWLYEATGAIVVSCVGGMDQRAERKHLERGVHIVVGTPGRLVDHLSRRALQLDGLAAVVLDEADEMLDLGFREDLETLLAATPETRRTLLFSATLPKGIVALANRFQRNAARVEVASETTGHADIEHRAAMVRPNGTEKAVVNLLREAEVPAALVFCNTRDAVRRLHATLVERGFSAVILSGELGQHERNQALQALRDGRARICIATDVAARGIDLPGLGLVIHADLPHDAEVLQHRSGRTGRAGRKGVSIMLVPPNRRAKAMRLYAEGGINPEWVALPTAEAIRALDQTRILADESPFAELVEADSELGAALLAQRGPEAVAAALARIIRARFPEPEEIDPLPLEAIRPSRKDQRAVPVEGPVPYRWFELSVGRQHGAEPKGILRMLTRSGGLERRHIGGIRIFDHACQVEIAEGVADRFARRHASPGPDEVIVRAIAEPDAKPKRNYGPKPEFEGKPDFKKKAGFRKKAELEAADGHPPVGARPQREGEARPVRRPQDMREARDFKEGRSRKAGWGKPAAAAGKADHAAPRAEDRPPPRGKGNPAHENRRAHENGRAHESGRAHEGKAGGQERPSAKTRPYTKDKPFTKGDPAKAGAGQGKTSQGKPGQGKPGQGKPGQGKPGKTKPRRS